jgi:hypothetical protein
MVGELTAARQAARTRMDPLEAEAISSVRRDGAVRMALKPDWSAPWRKQVAVVFVVDRLAEKGQ